MSVEHIHFVTGRLAEHSLRQVVDLLSDTFKFEYSIGVLPITVAALMTPDWIARRVMPPHETTRLLIPGYCRGNLEPIEKKLELPVDVGPKDLRRLPEYFGETEKPADYGQYDIEIIAEINECPRLTLGEIRHQANALVQDGADVIDLGCLPGGSWTEIADAVKALREDGHRISVDSMNPLEIEAAVRAGAELVLSVNSENLNAVLDLECKVVVIPDDPKQLTGLDQNIDRLTAASVPFRIDPILEPIGFGFVQSLLRYSLIRERYPSVEMMMGIGNLTELTDVDSAGVNVLLLAVCQELGIRSVLTTQVINWARSSVHECDLGRRLVYHAIHNQVLPKHLEPQLIMLRDKGVLDSPSAELVLLKDLLKDNNFRLAIADGEIHLVTAGLHLHDRDPFALMKKLMASGKDGKPPKNLDASHSFYLGFEMCKALTALTLSKNYLQDESLDWGFLTQLEPHQYLRSDRSQNG